ncbi:MAG: ABC transporter substrate-binding protein [Tagaea sp.]
MRRFAFAAAFLAFAAPAFAQPAQNTLRIGLTADPDVLDPALGRTLVGRMVFSSLCDTLVDYNEKLEFTPRLAQSWEWSNDGRALTLRIRPGATFHDGSPVDAAAVKASLDRARTMPQSLRRSELAPIAETVVVDPGTLRLDLRSPFIPLLAQLADRGGMVVNARPADAAGTEFGRNPICAGPYRFAERIAQDRIVLQRFDRHWERDQYHFDRVVFLPIPDATVRLANVQAGSVDFVERILPTDLPNARRDRRLKLADAVELGWNSIIVNTHNGARANNALARDKRVREALELSLDRDILNRAAHAGEFVAGNQPFAPGNPFHASELRPQPRNVARARELLRAAGAPNPSFTLMVPNDTERNAVAQIIQQMAREAGFDIRLQVVDFATSIQMSQNGDFEAYLLSWSGRVDPDGNMHTFFHCQGSQNDSKFCDPRIDQALDRAREVTDPAERLKLYSAATAVLLDERPRIFTYHRKWFFAYSSRLSDFTANPDGMIRVRGLRWLPQ